MRNQFLVYSLLASVSTATAGGTIGSAYGKDNGPAAVVKVAKSTCLSRYQRTITMSRSRHAEGLRLLPPENVTIDMRGITLLGQGPGSDAKSVTRVTGFKNVCLLGGRYLGKQDPQKVPWVVGHASHPALRAWDRRVPCDTYATARFPCMLFCVGSHRTLRPSEAAHQEPQQFPCPRRPLRERTRRRR